MFSHLYYQMVGGLVEPHIFHRGGSSTNQVMSFVQISSLPRSHLKWMSPKWMHEITEPLKKAARTTRTTIRTSNSNRMPGLNWPPTVFIITNYSEPSLPLLRLEYPKCPSAEDRNLKKLLQESDGLVKTPGVLQWLSSFDEAWDHQQQPLR